MIQFFRVKYAIKVVKSRQFDSYNFRGFFICFLFVNVFTIHHPKYARHPFKATPM